MYNRACVTDRFGTSHCTQRSDALAAFGDAVEAIAAHRPEAAAAIDRALDSDPILVAAHAVRGFGGVMLARAETLAAARQARDAARAAAAQHDGVTADEAVLLQALDRAVDGHLRATAAVLDRHLRHHPHALLLIKLSCSLRFMAGDLSGMRLLTTDVLRAWTPDMNGYGYVLGCHAFVLEETGDLAMAERIGLEAVEREPKDAWGLHAVAHVLETTGRSEEGIAWIERARPLWQGCNNFTRHLALFHLKQGNDARALDLYDSEIWAIRTEDFRDVANAVSLLWRLGQHGIDVGDRWDELAQIAHRRRHDTTLIFASLHHLLALVSVEDLDAANGLLMALQRRAADRLCDQGRVAATVGVPFARALLSDGMQPFPPLDDVAARLQALGGSHAQRDLFVRILLQSAARDEAPICATSFGMRRAMVPDDRFTERLMRRHGAPVLAAHAPAAVQVGL
jgi:tetratricopeptide (TPR) repeat protein